MSFYKHCIFNLWRIESYRLKQSLILYRNYTSFSIKFLDNFLFDIKLKFSSKLSTLILEGIKQPSAHSNRRNDKTLNMDSLFGKSTLAKSNDEIEFVSSKPNFITEGRSSIESNRQESEDRKSIGSLKDVKCIKNFNSQSLTSFNSLLLFDKLNSKLQWLQWKRKE